MKTLELTLVRWMEGTKKMFGCHTWQVEQALVFLILASVAITRIAITGEGWVEWLGVFAVSFSANHASVAKDLEFAEQKTVTEGGEAKVHCYKLLQQYFYAKEVCWLLYFIILGAYSALVGVGIFFVLGWWWKVWQKHRPDTLQET